MSRLRQSACHADSPWSINIELECHLALMALGPIRAVRSQTAMLGLYGIYLYAWPVQQFLVQSFGGRLNPWTPSLAALVVSGGLAWLSWTVVERPFLALKGRPRSDRRAPAEPAATVTASTPKTERNP
jgi:hypothetical protein